MRSGRMSIVVGSAVMVMLLSSAEAGTTATYVAGTTQVVRSSSSFGTVLDAGGVVCSPGQNSGIGGACIPFSVGTNAISVNDEVSLNDVAFQVCIDNSGDGVCTSGGFDSTPCGDTVFFSHGDGNVFFNPMGPLPQGFTRGCTGGFPGYVVFLCQGVHEDDGDAHVHPASTGTVSGLFTTDPRRDAFGNFCGAGGAGGVPGPPVNKPYVIV